MSWAPRAVPLLCAAALLVWIAVSAVYQDFVGSAENYLSDRGLLPSGSGAAGAASEVGVNSELVLRNRKDIDAILKKLGLK